MSVGVVEMDRLSLTPKTEGGTATNRRCVKCPEAGILSGLDPKKAVYCRPCFMQMVMHKFRSSIGRQRLFKDGESRKTVVIFDGTPAAAFLLGMIRSGLAADAHHRLQLDPVVVAVVTKLDRQEIDAVIKRIDTIKSYLQCDWHIVHLAAVLSDNLQDLSSSSSEICPGVDQLDRLIELFSSIRSESGRSEMKVRLRTALLYRMTETMGVSKMMTSDTADRLAKLSLSSLALGRGAQMSEDTAVVDKRHPKVAVIRPLKELSDKEVGIFNRFEQLDELTVIVGDPDRASPAVQTITDSFVTHLQAGFHSTLTTVLSSASKVKTATTSRIRCAFCFSSSDDRFCLACRGILDEVGEPSLLPSSLQ
uniref:Cytoplasmic tRNA 2-thiolation protein 2 n=1 Tax=Plectus sambesii TaxID=2011161 RepID=A0A914WJD0_9BILA